MRHDNFGTALDLWKEERENRRVMESIGVAVKRIGLREPEEMVIALNAREEGHGKERFTGRTRAKKY